MIDLKSLQEKAEKALHNDSWPRLEYEKVATPDVILSLCSELTAARERIQKLETSLRHTLEYINIPREDCFDDSQFGRAYDLLAAAPPELLEAVKAAK
jgi:hypothetical protein